MSEKRVIYLCHGPSCYSDEIEAVTNELRRLVNVHHLKDQIQVENTNCLGQCLNGIAAVFEESTFTDLTLFNLSSKFAHEILPCLR